MFISKFTGVYRQPLLSSLLSVSENSYRYLKFIGTLIMVIIVYYNTENNWNIRIKSKRKPAGSNI